MHFKNKCSLILDMKNVTYVSTRAALRVLTLLEKHLASSSQPRTEETLRRNLSFLSGQHDSSFSSKLLFIRAFCSVLR
jgi:hypothetical protein